MGPLELILTAVLLWVGFDVALVALAYLRGLAVRRHEAADRALRLRLAASRRDSSKTAGDHAMGGFGSVPDADVYLDHHTLAEYEAIAREETA